MGVPDLCGRVLGGQFTIGELIGEGGYGWVFEARQASPDRRVAVKVLRERAADPARARVGEAQALAQASHPNSVGVIISGVEDDGWQWIAMGLVPGTSLRAWLRSFGPMPLAEVVPLVEQIADALHTAHERGIVHRDLKPENIMVTPGRDGLTPTLLDFGIARSKHDGTRPDLAETARDALAEPGEERSRDGTVTSRGVVSTSRTTRRRPRVLATPTTAPGDPSGTPEYRAPEMARDPRSAGPAADVYALGLIAYELLAGRRPFDGATKEEWRELHETSMIGPIGLGSAVVYRAVHRALAKRPEDRPSPLEFARELRAALVADPAEQARAVARLWEARGRSPDLLWGPTAIAAAEQRMQSAQDDLVTKAFLTASRRRAQAFRWKVIAAGLAAAVVASAGAGLWYRWYKNEESAALAARAQFEQGRYALQQGDDAEAQRHLGDAYRRGDHSPATQFMLARASEPRLAELARFTSPSGHMWSAAFSPDGRRIVTTDDNAAQIQDTASKQLLLTLAHGGRVYQAMYSHDGARIITACSDGAVRIWDALAGTLVRELRYGSAGSQPRYFKVDTSADDRMVAAIDDVGAVAHVWDARAGVLLAKIDNDGSEFPSVAFSADGRWLATTGGNRASVFSTTTWAQVFSIPESGVRTFSWVPTAPQLLTGSTKGDVSLWKIPEGTRIHHLREVGEPIDRVAFAPSGELVATASRDGSEELWNARSGELQSRSNQLHDKIFAIEFDSTSKLVLAAGAGGAAVADAAQGIQIARFMGQGVVRIAHFDPTSRLVVGASMDGTARIWDATSPYRRWSSLPLGEGCSDGQSVVPDGRFVATNCKGHSTLVWDTAHAQLLAELPAVSPAGENFETAFPAVSTEGDRAAIAHGNTVEVYELPGGRLVRTIQHHAAVSSVAFASSGGDVVSGAVDGSLLVTRGNGEELALPVAAGGIDAAGFLPDGRVVAADAQQNLRVYHSGGAPIAELEVSGRVRLLRVSPDGRALLAISRLTKAVQPTLFDMRNLRRITQLKGHLGIVYTARFILGGSEILTAGIDGTARRWDAATGELRQTYRGGSRYVEDAAASSDGSMVVGGGADGVLRFWDLASGLPLWTLPAHKTPLVGVHFEDGTIVSRGLAGDISRWVLPDPERAIAACGAAETCGIVPP